MTNRGGSYNESVTRNKVLLGLTWWILCSCNYPSSIYFCILVCICYHITHKSHILVKNDLCYKYEVGMCYESIKLTETKKWIKGKWGIQDTLVLENVTIGRGWGWGVLVWHFFTLSCTCVGYKHSHIII